MSSGFTGCYGFPTTQAIVLQAVVGKIRANIPSLDGDNLCFLSTKPEPIETDRQNIICVVSPMTGEFDRELWTGGGPNGGVVEHTGIFVTVWNYFQLDRNDESTALLTDASRGMLELKRQLLKALLNTGDLQDASGNNILIEPLAPRDSGHPNHDSNQTAEFHLVFAASFAWDLMS